MASAAALGCRKASARSPPTAARATRRAGRQACPARREGARTAPQLPLTVTHASGGGVEQPGAALAAAAQRAASSAASGLKSAGMQLGEAALKGALNAALGTPDAAPVEQVTVTQEQLAAQCSALGLVLGERLGKGSRATVFAAVGAPLPSQAAGARAGAADAGWRATPGQTVAVKALLDDVSPPTLAELASEAELWGSLRHDGIVRLLHASLAPAPLLVLEACEGGTLFAALRRGDALDVRSLTLDVAQALAAVHASGQTHRDVKSANVLLTRGEQRLTAKLCDWGSAALLKDSLPARPLPPTWPSTLFAGVGGGAPAPVTWTPVGTLLWMAPEMLDPHVQGATPPKGASGATADVYSFGVLLWELLERRLPWVEPVKVKRAEVLRVIIKEGKRLPISDWVSKELADLLQQCWAADPRKRPTMEQVVTRLSALKAWDTDGRLARLARGEVALEPQASPVKAVFNDSVRAAVRTSGSTATPAMSSKELARVIGSASLTSDEDEDEKMTRSETEAVVESPTPPPPSVRPVMTAALNAELGTLMSAALTTATDSEAGGEVLLSAVLPYAYQLEVGPVFKAELDSLVARMKATEVRLAQLEDRRKFDPLAAVVSDGKQQELQMLTTKVQTMRAEAAVKAWARVAAIMSLASQSASKEYAAARRLLDEAKAAAAMPPKPRGRR